MAIPPSGTFDFTAIYDGGRLETGEPVLDGTSLRSKSEPSLAGQRARIVLNPYRTVLAFQEGDPVWTISFVAGDAIAFVIERGDRLFLSRSQRGGMGVSLLRGDELVIAIGAASIVPLGESFRVEQGPGWEDVEGGAKPWVGFGSDAQERRLTARETAALSGHDLYVESTWSPGFPGRDECVSISTTAISTLRDRAFRSAVLLAHGDFKITGWETGTGDGEKSSDDRSSATAGWRKNAARLLRRVLPG